jgi:hypothetical protein
MSMEAWLDGQRSLGNKAAVAMGKKLLKEFGEVPLPSANRPVPKDSTSKTESVIDLSKEWENQGKRYVELGFHKELGMSSEEYLASLPRFEPQPEKFQGRFDIPLLVETRIKPAKQAELAGLPYYLSDLNV